MTHDLSSGRLMTSPSELVFMLEPASAVAVLINARRQPLDVLPSPCDEHLT